MTLRDCPENATIVALLITLREIVIRETVQEKVEKKKRDTARNSNWWAKGEAEAKAGVEV